MLFSSEMLGWNLTVRYYNQQACRPAMLPDNNIYILYVEESGKGKLVPVLK